MPDIAPATLARPVLAECDASQRVILLAGLQAALAALGIQSVLVRNRRLVLHDSGPWEPSGPTDPQLHIFLADGTEAAATDGTRYQFTTGPAYPADDPKAAAASLRDRLHAQPATQEVQLAVAYLSLIRRVVARRILPLSWALRLGAPFRADDARRTDQDHDSTGGS